MLVRTRPAAMPASEPRRRRIPVALVASLLAVAAASCNRAGASVAGSTGSSKPADAAAQAAGGGGGAAQSVAAIPADADPCGWIPSADATRLLGPLAGAPRRGHDAENTDATSDGRACVFTLAGRGPGGLPREVAVEVVPGEATSEQAGVDAGAALARKILGGGKDQDPSDERAHAKNGWDYSNWIPDQFLGRLGHVAVRVGLHQADVPDDSAERLATLVRDRLPDIPFAAERRKWNNSDDPDPCTLLTRAEAEAVLGKLKVPPYRSNDDSPLVDPTGKGCSYYASHHRVFTIKPEWDEGKTLFRVSTGASQAFGGIIGQLTGANTQTAADTLEGVWDQAGAGLDGALYLLKGDRMLTVAYRTAGIDAGAALRLATPAVRRLSSH